APVSVLFRSIMDHADPHRYYDLIYLHNGVKAEDLEKLCSMAETKQNVSIRSCDIRPLFREEGLYTENRRDLSAMTYARLVLPEALSEEYHRALYLDGDMIAFRDVGQLFDSDLEGKPLGSTVDFGFLSNVYGRQEIRHYAETQLGLTDVETYTMAAVQLMDLDQFRRGYPVEKLWEIARSRQWIWHDQDVINHVLRGQICLLDPAWDVIVPDDGTDYLPTPWKGVYDRVRKEPYLFHFAGSNGKPWKTLSSPYAMEFWSMARKTPFYHELWSRLCQQESSYDRIYAGDVRQQGWGRCLLRKILPPPADSVQRDLRNLLACVDGETKTTLLLMRKLRRLQWQAAGKRDSTAQEEGTISEELQKERGGQRLSADEVPVCSIWEDAVTVVCCGDEQFVAPTGVLIRSMMDHRDPQRHYDILYLHNGISDESARKLCCLGAEQANVSIRTVDIRGIFTEGSLYVENRENFSAMAYARFLIPQVLSDAYHRALYLDGDMLAFQDVARLYDQDLEGMPVGAVVDMYYVAEASSLLTDEARQRVTYMQDVVGIHRPEQYSISGMLLMDLDLWRQQQLSVRLMETARAYRWQWHDQDVINHMLRGQIQSLDPVWNSYDIGEMKQYLPRALRDAYQRGLLSPGIFHFAGAREKPWTRPYPRYTPQFWDTAYRTPFGDELILRLFHDLNTYDTYSPQNGGTKPMLKRLLKKILPPPVDSVQRDLRTVLNAIDEQKKLNYLLMQQMDELQCQLDSWQRQENQTIEKTIPSTGGVAVKTPRQRLRFEFALASHCNLNCAGCSHFAPLSGESYPDLEESRQAFARLSQLFGGECEYIHLMGGEPLLNPQCTEYLCMAREAFPRGEIYLMTNGVLLPKMEDAFYQICRENNIIISVTHYPIALDQEAIRARCQAHGVRFEYFRGDAPQTHFQRYLLDPEGRQDGETNFARCPHANSCLFLYENRMYPCGIGAHMRIFEAYFHKGMELPEEDGVDIYGVRSGRDLLYRLAKASPRCRYCNVERWEEQAPWRVSKKAVEEWTDHV
ncbi:MAG: 4Fe-4S cluster-binding domain-containing protein, partial [Lachnospiraceae bacterium]|nr:4Fe-4S cluster-binding domain-containing protein [Lachnospiraceae bacterium]